MSKIDQLLQKTDEDVQAVRKLFNVNEKIVQDSIGLLKTWIKQSPHLPQELRSEDRFLEGVLLYSKFSVERSKKTIERYFCLKLENMDLFIDVYPSHEDVKLINEIIYCIPLPKLTKDQERIGVFKIRNEQLLLKYAHKYQSLLTYFYLMFQLALLNDYQSANIAILDFKGVSLGNITDTWARAACMVKYVKPLVRIKAVHIVNPPIFTSFVLNIIQTVNPKIAKRVVIHNNVDCLHDHIEKELLPTEYNGTGASLEKLNSGWLEELQRHDVFFLKLIDQLKNIDRNIFNEFSSIKGQEPQGTFRKLDID